MKLPKAVVLYLDEEHIDMATDTPKGAVCGKCMMFLTDVSECSILKPPQVSGTKGVCGFYVGGDPQTSEDHKAMMLMPRGLAGYTEDGPTRCLECQFFKAPMRCEKVEGAIEANGCCNGWKGKP